METKKFTKNDSGFTCVNCGKPVPSLGYTSRNHCPFCLHSVHVDIMPGDRMNPCGGLLVPDYTEPHPKKGFIINFVCKKCGAHTRNTSARDDLSSLLIKLTNRF